MTPEERIADLERQLAGAKEDTADLDWLEANPEAGEPIMIYHPPSDLITWHIKSDKPGVEYKTLREAIRAARKEAK